MKLQERLPDLIAWVKRQAYHFVFISSLMLLTILVAWWAFSLYTSVNQNYRTRLDGVRQSVRSYSLFSGHNSLEKPALGKYWRDDRLEVVHAHESPGPEAKQLVPYWPGLWLQPDPAFLENLMDRRWRRRFMVVGESSLLVILILVSGLMIYRMYWLEKRTTQELHELWSRVSHEIKTPITGVKAFLETMQSQPLSREEMEPLIQLALKQVERQQQLTENMLVGQKLKRRASGIKLKRIRLQDFIQSYLERHPFRLTGGNVFLDGPLQESDLTKVSADPEALRIIFDNLIENARKYGGDDVTVRFRLERKANQLMVSVEDNGPGFEPDMSKNIFKAYRRLENELPGKQQKGTGMGLYISRRLAKQMGGNLSAYSEGKGTGARFTLTFKKGLGLTGR